MKKILVLGAGLIGAEIAKILSTTFHVTVVDANNDALQRLSGNSAITPVQEDFTQYSRICNLARQHDIIVGAMPGFLAYQTIAHLISAGKPIVDISFFPEDPFDLNSHAQTHGIPVVIDCGVAPGMSNLLLGYETTLMDVRRFRCFVGGLPKKHSHPWDYKAPFEVKSVIDEYLRPARLKENGILVTKTALSDPERIEFEGIGILEAFNTDGLRTLIRTVPVPDMVEKTLRYPGYRDVIEFLLSADFFSREPIPLSRDQAIIPFNVTSALLSRFWKLDRGEEEFTVMRLVMEGSKNGEHIRSQYDLLDRGDLARGVTSMARATAYPCAAVVRLVADGCIRQTGVVPPEYIGKDALCVRYILDFLAERGVIYTHTRISF